MKCLFLSMPLSNSRIDSAPHRVVTPTSLQNHLNPNVIAGTANTIKERANAFHQRQIPYRFNLNGLYILKISSSERQKKRICCDFDEMFAETPDRSTPTPTATSPLQLCPSPVWSCWTRRGYSGGTPLGGRLDPHPRRGTFMYTYLYFGIFFGSYFSIRNL